MQILVSRIIFNKLEVFNDMLIYLAINIIIAAFRIMQSR